MGLEFNPEAGRTAGTSGAGPKKVADVANANKNLKGVPLFEMMKDGQRITYKDFNGDGQFSDNEIMYIEQYTKNADGTTTGRRYIDKNGDGYSDKYIDQTFDKDGNPVGKAKVTVQEDINKVKAEEQQNQTCGGVVGRDMSLISKLGAPADESIGTLRADTGKEIPPKPASQDHRSYVSDGIWSLMNGGMGDKSIHQNVRDYSDGTVKFDTVIHFPNGDEIRHSSLKNNGETTTWTSESGSGPLDNDYTIEYTIDNKTGKELSVKETRNGEVRIVNYNADGTSNESTYYIK